MVQLKPDEKSLDGPSGAEEDFTDLHAWCEVFLPGAGWVGLDPTSGLFASEGHIPLACTPDPVSAAPIEGFTDKCEVEFEHSNEVSRILEDPRVTKPYSEEQWAEVMSLGDSVDDLLEELDVRLTMGGEPTFVSIDDMEDAQWNTGALGEQKLSLAKTLLLKLRNHFAPKGLLHYGQGKWYPGEEVPRWALGVFWRTDGEPFWHEPEWLARIDKDYGYSARDAKKFMCSLTKVLGIEKTYGQPAYEDALYYLLQERKLPTNIDSALIKAKTDSDRTRLAKILERGMGTPTGFLLPLEWDAVADCWHTCMWETRRDHVTLTPGDSPMGLRLPLSDLPISTETEMSLSKDPFAPQEPLPTKWKFPMSPVQAVGPDITPAKEPIQQTPGDKRALEAKAKEAAVLDDDDSELTEEEREKLRQWRQVIRTTLCVEARNGRMYVFMPPVYSLDNYVELIAAVEKTAKRLKMPVIIEGYEPPKDSRMQKLLVTPDPGVIEVNIHPSSNWQELVSNTTELYAAARESRLGTEKFMLDGRHTGTGGGNHITLGGKTPADSPMLRRPDILRSLVTFWQHHPSLSYVFSGAFVGPTSQAPRVDEGRDEMLYEMETAFQQIPEGIVDQPWLIDRIMRNLLTDITGNTHRAEFCMDKLYSPDGPTGRLGLLEFRGFEMPPHSRMALVQSLLIRTLVARFWQEPYHKPLVRWGTQLHDRFMLPHYLWTDMKEVVQDLNDHGFPFRAEWLLPFEEFRFPHYGRTKLDDMEIELRWAVEPWNVLGEESGSSGTARYVDSSVERLQVKVSGVTEDRYVLACNGRRVPLRGTGRQGESVAGVRYKAWAPPSALHPTIGVHTPLVFDLIDTWNGRSIGGCTYHVSHPGGRSYETFPVNAFEAESRRGNRFDNTSFTSGPYTPKPEVDALRTFYPSHLPKPMAPPAEESPDEYPCTLDLRRQPPAGPLL